MKNKYSPPSISVATINIENSLCNGSSTIQISNNEEDFLSEWDQQTDDERSIQW